MNVDPADEEKTIETFHGCSVVSSYLYGPLGETLRMPYSFVDYYPVFPKEIEENDDSLYDVIIRIQNILKHKHYDFINMSIGPDLPIEDDEVHPWTSILDQYIYESRSFYAIAAGNNGGNDRDTGLARIQVPADCVNGISVGSCIGKEDGSVHKAGYSAFGPGRIPGVVKPDVLEFGGVENNEFYTFFPHTEDQIIGTLGTSYSAPYLLRKASAIRAHIGSKISPIAVKSVLIHHANSYNKSHIEVGWGRVPDDIEEMLVCKNGTVKVLYQGELHPSKVTRAQIPMPDTVIRGDVTISATFCFLSDIDPEHPSSYTHSGLNVTFRPNESKRSKSGQLHADAKSFFKQGKPFQSEVELRHEAHKWETVLNETRKFRGTTLNEPVFDIHYNARMKSQATKEARPIPYALFITIEAKQAPDIYNMVLTRYKNELRVIRPVINIPVRV